MELEDGTGQKGKKVSRTRDYKKPEDGKRRKVKKKDGMDLGKEEAELNL